MPTETTPVPGVMEGRGAYNQHGKVPVNGAALALPLLEKAVQSIALDTNGGPVTIADYGSSQGKNSLVPIGRAIQCLRQRVGSNKCILVFHIDQASNDFNTLFGVLEAEQDSYSKGAPNVYAAGVGRSFYQSVLPGGCVHLGWCSYAAVWLSKVPMRIPGHIFPHRATGDARREFERQAVSDWETFLCLRGRELRPGGRLVVVLPGLGEDGLSGFEEVMDRAISVLDEMAEEGSIKPQEREQMALGVYPRRREDLLEPFEEGHFNGLRVEHLEIFNLPDTFWADYERDGDKQSLATRQSLFFRAVFMPTLATALEQVRAGSTEALRNFGDRLQAGLTRRLMDRPHPMHSLVQVLVLAKESPGL